jgi:hypothetical protein
MVNWHRLEVPRLDWHLVDALGAERSRGAWWCTQTQFRSRNFKRWRSVATHRKVVVYPGDGRREREETKQYRCLWSPTDRHWYVYITEQSSLRTWHRARLQPPIEYTIRVDYAEREKAKAAGCRWNPNIKKWVYACHGPPPGFVTRRRLDQPATVTATAAAA